ncbi:hypothetical protein RUM43_006550 [Polyplax serrata]|uniref:Uncharacterized protein n=1 Tax=Polyplax serrata TaxID=468196 RepID=A0AAN8S291_POLSC
MWMKLLKKTVPMLQEKDMWAAEMDGITKQPENFRVAKENKTKKKKFHPLRNLRRMFRRKCRRSSISADSYQAAVPDNSEIPQTNLEQRSCSTSRLQEENLSLISNNRLNPGLSLSHDSIFTPDRADSGLSSSDLGNSSLSITVLTPPSKDIDDVVDSGFESFLNVSRPVAIFAFRLMSTVTCERE